MPSGCPLLKAGVAASSRGEGGGFMSKYCQKLPGGKRPGSIWEGVGTSLVDPGAVFRELLFMSRDNRPQISKRALIGRRWLMVADGSGRGSSQGHAG